MANKLLEGVKNLGYSHDEVLEILKAAKEAESSIEEDPDEEDESDDNEEPEGNSDIETDKKGSNVDVSKLTESITKNINETITKTVSESVSKELKAQLKKLRGKPPAGTDSEDPLGVKPMIQKNLFERIV